MLARSASLQLCHQHRCGWGRDRQAGVPFQGWQHQQPSSRAGIVSQPSSNQLTVDGQSLTKCDHSLE